MIARRIIVRGKVQGVFYRNWTLVTARSLRLNGWVRNLSSGEVEILAIGSAEAVEDLIRQCWEGPFGAVVEEVAAEKVPLEPVLGFEIRRTA
jgi:acylphosphatase